MVRGHAKEQAQQRNAKKQSESKQGISQIEARQAGLKVVCPLCKAPATGSKALQLHYESKHPKETPPI
jgi:hypothetical protein